MTADLHKRTICDEAGRLCGEQFGRQLRAVVLSGSLSRDEATLVNEGNVAIILGDAEFLLVFRERSGLPPRPALDLLGQRIEDALLRAGIHVHITLTAVSPVYLRRLRPHVFAYELRACGRVVWGEPNILALIPAFSPTDIPAEDGWRLLCNRIVEQLELSREASNGREAPSRELHYRTVKLYLDMATSLLLFAGAYAPTYRERERRLRILADAEARDGWPFPLQTFAETISACTQWKLLPTTANGSTGWEFWQAAREYARQLFRWELARLTGTEGQLPDPVLWERWMRLQPIRHRLRGWLYVVRAQGWHRSWPNWPRWSRLAWRASPRYWVYAVASELFFKLACPGEPTGERSLDIEALRQALPVSRAATQRKGRRDWQELASDVAWTYRQFLVETRA